MLELPTPFALVGMVLFPLIGVWAIKEGRREANIKQLLLGFLLIGYSYFVSPAWLIWGIGLALVAAVYRSRG